LCSLTPSLLPRSWQVQGLISGISCAAAYAVGVALTWVGRHLGLRPLSAVIRRRTWYGIAAIAVVGVPITLWLSASWQGDVRHAVRMPSQGRYLYLGVFAIAAAVIAGLIGVGRLLKDLYHVVMRPLMRFVPLLAAKMIAAAVVVLLAVGVLTGVVYRGLLQFADTTFSAADRGSAAGLAPPTSGLRSGSPASLVPWTTLGWYGRAFVSAGPTPADIKRLTGRPAVPSVRVYAGLASAASLQAEARLVLSELKRTGAFDRALLAVATTTGRGWVDSTVADPLEYMYGGNTAIAAMQYSYLPSWVSFLVDQAKARQAGRMLFNTVYDYWASLPAGHRPRLVVFGESLGAFGANAAFSSVADLTARTSGALFVGPPNRTERWRQLTAARSSGSPERLPVYGDGQTVRFAATAADLRTPDGSLRSPKIVFLQHASDPVVWWSPDLMWQRPDWLDEPTGPDVASQVRWFPFLTFWQVTCDLIISVDPPPGYGHHYGPEVPTAWAAILHPPAWTDANTAALT
jgi:uncharacterized membrane protein